jgi:mRNA-degrading endonuclease toxin of MazEF toxin-antitoxin module
MGRQWRTVPPRWTFREDSENTCAEMGQHFALRIPKSFAAELGLDPNSSVEISLRDGKLVVVPSEKPKFTFKQLLAQSLKKTVTMSLIPAQRWEVRCGYPFEVLVPPGLSVTGAILADQVKNLDWRAREAELICSLPRSTVAEVLQKALTLFLE